ncbi:MAG: hypothetical protein Q4E69_03775, partial [Bacilli bacterium]|nr:hypothetical protein [Bacilli bacterium]
MLKLRNILLHNTIFIIILVITIYLTVIRIVFEKNYQVEDISIPTIITIKNYHIDGNKLVIDSSNIRSTYYIKTYKEKISLENKLKVGDKYKVYGEVSISNNNYLKVKKINYLIKVSSLYKIKSTNNVLYILKNIIIKRLNKNPY